MPHILDSHSPSDMYLNQSRPARYDHLARLTPHARQHLLHLFVLQTRVVVDVHAHHLGSGREAWSQEATLDSIDLSQSSHSPCHPINCAEKSKSRDVLRCQTTASVRIAQLAATRCLKSSSGTRRIAAMSHGA